MNSLFVNGFKLTSKTGIKIDIPINAKISIIKGDSATGKTKMIRELSAILNTNDVLECNIDTKNIIVIKDMDAYNLFIHADISNHIVFIDKFDLTDFKQSIPFIQNSQNFFVLCAHSTLPRCDYERDSILELQYNPATTYYKLTPLKY